MQIQEYVTTWYSIGTALVAFLICGELTSYAINSIRVISIWKSSYYLFPFFSYTLTCRSVILLEITGVASLSDLGLFQISSRFCYVKPVRIYVKEICGSEES